MYIKLSRKERQGCKDNEKARNRKGRSTEKYMKNRDNLGTKLVLELFCKM